MTSDRRLLIVLAVLLLAGGALFSTLWPRQAAVLSAPGDLWQARHADLLLQLAILFVGVVGIRALLPGEREED